MNFDYSPDEQEIQQHIRRLLGDACPPSLVRGLLDSPSDAWTGLWRTLCEQGWVGAAIPAAYGGAEQPVSTLCAIAEELGRAAAPLPFFPSVYGFAEALKRWGTEAQREAWLPKLVEGAIGSVFLDPGVSLSSDGKLQGEASPAPYGEAAEAMIVAAGGGLWLVDLSAAGVSRQPLRTLDDSRGQAKVRFEGVAAERLDAPSGAAETLRDILAVFLAFEQLGGAEACLEQARAYALERRAFGRAIASQQAIKHLLADMYAAKELARSNAYYAAWALAADAPELPLAAATARVSSSEAYELAARENIQVHGGMGFTWEADAHLHYRRAMALSLQIGSINLWRTRLAVALASEAA